MEKNRRYFLALDPSIRIENFAYPYGFASVSHKRQLGKAFRSARGILPGVNSGAIDLQFLRSTPRSKPISTTTALIARSTRRSPRTAG